MILGMIAAKLGSKWLRAKFVARRVDGATIQVEDMSDGQTALMDLMVC